MKHFFFVQMVSGPSGKTESQVKESLGLWLERKKEADAEIERAIKYLQDREITTVIMITDKLN